MQRQVGEVEAKEQARLQAIKDKAAWEQREKERKEREAAWEARWAKYRNWGKTSAAKNDTHTEAELWTKDMPHDVQTNKDDSSNDSWRTNGLKRFSRWQNKQAEEADKKAQEEEEKKKEEAAKAKTDDKADAKGDAKADDKADAKADAKPEEKK